MTTVTELLAYLGSIIGALLNDPLHGLDVVLNIILDINSSLVNAIGSALSLLKQASSLRGWCRHELLG